MTLLLSSMWRNVLPFPSTLLNFTSYRALQKRPSSHTAKSAKNFSNSVPIVFLTKSEHVYTALKSPICSSHDVIIARRMLCCRGPTIITTTSHSPPLALSPHPPLPPPSLHIPLSPLFVRFLSPCVVCGHVGDSWLCAVVPLQGPT